MRSILTLPLVALCLGAGAAAHGQVASGTSPANSAVSSADAAPPGPSPSAPTVDAAVPPTAAAAPPSAMPDAAPPPGDAASPRPAPAPADDLGPDPTAPQAGAGFPGDPLEKFNRKIWGVNMAIDRIALRPASSVYRHITPRPIRHGLSRVLSNLGEPWSFVNNMLQGHPDRAARNLGRFVVNTTIGVGGLADHASEFGIGQANEDFGQTLAVWGVMKFSPYLVLPLLGPSTIRDGIGTVVAMYADPYHICLKYCVDTSFWTRTAITAFTAVSARADATEAGADTFLDSSLDSYAAARSAYLQERAAAIANENDGNEMSSSGDAVATPPSVTPAPALPAAAAPDATAPAPAEPDATPSPADDPTPHQD